MIISFLFLLFFWNSILFARSFRSYYSPSIFLSPSCSTDISPFFPLSYLAHSLSPLCFHFPRASFSFHSILLLFSPYPTALPSIFSLLLPPSLSLFPSFPVPCPSLSSPFSYRNYVYLIPLSFFPVCVSASHPCLGCLGAERSHAGAGGGGGGFGKPSA